MRIGYVTTYFYPIFGGVENNVFNSACELSKKHEIHVFTSNLKDGKTIGKNEEAIKGIKIHRLPTRRYRYYLASYPLLTKKIIKEKPDILHFHSFGILQHDLTLFSLKAKGLLKKIPCVCTPHGPMMATSFNKPWQKLIGGFYQKTFGKIANSFYNGVVEVNPFQYEWIKKCGVNGKNIRLIPNGVPKKILDLKTKQEKIKIFKKRFKLKDKKIILSIGRLLKYKGFQDVVKILPKLKDTVYIIVGDGEYKDKLKELATKNKVKEKIIFAAEVTEDTKFMLFDLCDCFVLPSQYEAFGITLLEAMARKKPVVSTKTEGGRFLIENGKNGFLFDFGNKEKLLECINKSFKSRNVGKNGFEKAKRFTWDKITLELERLYEELVI